MSTFTVKDKYVLNDLKLLVTALRDPEEGCPWDKEQTHESIRQNMLEEACELMEAIDRADPAMLQEELGDVLLQVMLHAEMESEKGNFDVDDVADALCKKLVFRHPHIFGEVVAEDSDAVLNTWEDRKRLEKSQKSGTDAINAVPRTFPALMRSQKVQKRAAYVGFDYPDCEGALADLESEIAELREAIACGKGVEEELGDVLFAAVNVARFQHLDAERALELSCDKFAARFAIVEELAAQRNIDIHASDIDALNDIWREAKHELNKIQEESKND